MLRSIQRFHPQKVLLLLGTICLILLTKISTVDAVSWDNMPNTGIYRFTVGSFKVATIADGLLTLPPLPTYAPMADPEIVEQAIVERFWPPDELSVYFNAFFVDTGIHKVLIDTGAGMELGSELGKLPENLSSLGIQPQDIDTVIITHAHPDHIGGIVASDGQLTFPNAQYYISATEWQFWTAPTVDLASLIIPEEFKQGITMAARKHLGAIASNVIQFQSNQEIVPGITAIAAPGHTPGQSALQITSGESQLIVAADVFFNEAFDLEHPEWQTGFDLDSQQAAATRRRLLDQIA